MLSSVNVNGKPVTLDPSNTVGIGGEAAVYDIGSGRALKVFKEPDHDDYKNPDGSANLIEQEGAKNRLEVHQEKLPELIKLSPSFPAGIVTPEGLVTESNGRIIGYVMKLVKDAEPIAGFRSKSAHDQGLDKNDIMFTFCYLHTTISGLHEVEFVMGDFNPLNVLVRKNATFVIDTDSGQFGKFHCRVYTDAYVDPRLCDPIADSPTLIDLYNKGSDWYSFAIILMESMLCVGPYGGTFPRKMKVKQKRRPLERQTIFDPEVKFPTAVAFHYGILPDDLLQVFFQVFKKDNRDPFPLKMLQDIRWTRCTTCGIQHARAKCPQCDKAAPAAIKEVTVISGTVKSTRIFQTKGIIVFATCQDGKMRWLYHENGMYKRETGSNVVKGSLNYRLRFRIQGEKTLLGQKGKVLTFTPDSSIDTTVVDNFGNLPVFDATADSSFWLAGGKLMKDAGLAPSTIGNVLNHQTLFWTGSTFGFGFYRAGDMQVAFVFNPKKIGVKDSVKIPLIKGRLIDSTCFFSSSRCWFITQTQFGGKTVNHCTVIKADGSIVATAEAEDGDDSWLSQIRGKSASGDALFVATDEGIIRVSPNGSGIVKDAEFPDTAKFVNSGCHIFVGGNGIYVTDGKEVRLLQIG